MGEGIKAVGRITIGVVGFFVALIVGSIVVALGLYGLGIISDTPPAATVAAAPHWDKSESKQAERHALIDEAIRLGVFAKVIRHGEAMPEIWTGKAFQGVEFDTKKNTASVVYAFYFDGNRSSDFVNIIDGRTGKDIGQFDSVWGLRLN